jgi:hypothetical protein
VTETAQSQLRGQPIGEVVDGYQVAVVNDRAVRVASVILFVAGVTGWSYAVSTGDFSLARGFAVLFIVEMGIRIGVGARFAPLYALSALSVSRIAPRWVGAPQKGFAWGLGFVLSVSACFAFGWLNLPVVALSICAVCLSLLGAEAIFGWCVGCAIYGRIWPEKTFHCADGSCEIHRH